MAEKKLDIQYDQSADVLYCSFGPPQEAVGEEVTEGIVVRRHPNTNDVVGVTVIDFSRRLEMATVPSGEPGIGFSAKRRTAASR